MRTTNCVEYIALYRISTFIINKNTRGSRCECPVLIGKYYNRLFCLNNIKSTFSFAVFQS